MISIKYEEKEKKYKKYEEKKKKYKKYEEKKKKYKKNLYRMQQAKMVRDI